MSQEETNLDPNAYFSQNPLGSGGAGFSDTSGTGLPTGFIPPPRLKIQQGSRGQKIIPARALSGNYGLVSAEGTVQEFYQPTREAMTILSGLDDITRSKVQEKLFRKGWYGSSKPGNGYSDADRNAMADLLLLANNQGYTWDVLFSQLDKAPDVNLLGSSGKTKPSSADLTEILQRTALETIGKKLDDKTVSNLVSSYQGVYTADSTESAPSADVFFENRINQQYGADSEAYKYLNAISNVSRVLGSM
jgi:hypothetical protein